jgi:hypothetical protein
LAFALTGIASAIILMPFDPGLADGEGASPIFGVTIPDGYHQWQLIAPSHEGGRADGDLTQHRLQPFAPPFADLGSDEEENDAYMLDHADAGIDGLDEKERSEVLELARSYRKSRSKNLLSRMSRL